MDHDTRQNAINLYAAGINVPTIAVLLNVDRGELEVAINDAETHGSPIRFTGDNDDWGRYAQN
jgi:hypothetical protein